MENRTLPAAGQQFIDRNNNLVQFIALAVYESMNTEMAVYQALTGDYRVYTMPWIEFIREMQPFVLKNVNAQSENTAKDSEYLKSVETINLEEKVNPEGAVRQGDAVRIESNIQIAETANISYERREEAGGVNPVLMDFLDAKNYEEKLNILTGSRKHLNERILNHMAISVDCNIGEGDIDDKVNNLIYCLKTHARFENRRLR